MHVLKRYPAAWVGAALSPALPPGGTGMVEMIAGGIVFAVLAAVVWLWGVGRVVLRPLRARASGQTSEVQ